MTHGHAMSYKHARHDVMQRRKTFTQVTSRVSHYALMVVWWRTKYGNAAGSRVRRTHVCGVRRASFSTRDCVGRACKMGL